MNQRIYSALALAVVLLFGIAVDLVEAQENAASIREGLRQRIDPSASKILLQPAGEPRLATMPKERFDRQRFAKGLSEILGEPQLMDPEASDSRRRVEGTDHLIDFDPERQRFLFRDKRGLATETEGVTAQPSEQPTDRTVAATARRLLAAIGVNPAQTTSYEVAKLGVAEHLAAADGAGERSGEPAVTVTAVAKKVFIQRTIGEIPVLGDRMVVTFARDGSVRKMLGRWRATDYAASRLRSSISEEQLIEKALDALVAHGVDPDSDLPITLRTGYGAQELEPGVYALELKGLAVVELRGPNGSRKIGLYDFAL